MITDKKCKLVLNPFRCIFNSVVDMYAIDTFYQAVLSWDFYDGAKNPSSTSAPGNKRQVVDETARTKNVKRQKLDHNGVCNLTGEEVVPDRKTPTIQKKPTRRKPNNDVASFHEKKDPEKNKKKDANNLSNS
jgi:hypothetical protein